MGNSQKTASPATLKMSEDTKSINHILIVDDEVEFVGSVRRHLKRKGFHPDFAFNGESACRKMISFRNENLKYDLVITDVVMPRMDGISLLQWIHDKFPETSVVVVSEFMGLSQLEARIRPELDAVGRKPMTPEQMMGLIESISCKRSACRRARQYCRGASDGECAQTSGKIIEIFPGSDYVGKIPEQESGVGEEKEFS